MKKAFLALFICLFVFNGASEFIELDDEEVWRYYGPEPSLDSPSNHFNVIVNKSVQDLLYDADWRTAGGTERYAYFNHSDEDEWKTADVQLEKGNYHGNRHHVRIYRSPWSDYEVIQAHYEHFNWLTVRHEVTSNEKAMNEVKQDLMVKGLELESEKKGFGVLATTASLMMGLVAGLKSRKLLLILVFPAIILLTRFFGVLLSEVITNPYLVTGPIYLVLVTSTLVAALKFGEDLENVDRGILVFSAVVFGFMLDAIYTGGIPINEVVQKTGFALFTGVMAYYNQDSYGKRLLAVFMYVSWLLVILTGFF